MANRPHPTTKSFEAFYRYVQKIFCSRTKRHVGRQQLTLDKRLGRWFSRQRHSRNKLYCTPEWLHNISWSNGREEIVMSNRQSPNMVDCFFQKHQRGRRPCTCKPSLSCDLTLWGQTTAWLQVRGCTFACTSAEHGGGRGSFQVTLSGEDCTSI